MLREEKMNIELDVIAIELTRDLQQDAQKFIATYLEEYEQTLSRELTNQERSDAIEHARWAAHYILYGKVLEFMAPAAKEPKTMLLELAGDTKPGTNVELMKLPHYTVAVDTKRPAERMDAAEFKNQLRLAGIEPELIAKCAKKATKQNKPARSISIITE